MFEWITAREPDGTTVRRRCRVLGTGPRFLRTQVLDAQWDPGHEVDTYWLIEHDAVVRRTRMIEDRHTGAMRRRRKGE